MRRIPTSRAVEEMGLEQLTAGHAAFNVYKLKAQVEVVFIGVQRVDLVMDDHR